MSPSSDDPPLMYAMRRTPVMLGLMVLIFGLSKSYGYRLMTDWDEAEVLLLLAYQFT